jgi:hypothetical protein
MADGSQEVKTRWVAVPPHHNQSALLVRVRGTVSQIVRETNADFLVELRKHYAIVALDVKLQKIPAQIKGENCLYNRIELFLRMIDTILALARTDNFADNTIVDVEHDGEGAELKSLYHVITIRHKAAPHQPLMQQGIEFPYAG